MSNATDNHIASETPEQKESRRFDLFDSKGREFGFSWATWEAQIEEGGCGVYAGEFCGWSSLPTGLHYGIQGGVTRNGERYGASSHPRFFETEEERSAYLAKRIEAALKRAKKG